jgi:formylglycine-generating enzyme required for sulfatase activity
LQRVERAIELVDAARESSLGARASDWDEAARSIADPASCPLYQGLRLARQHDLAPLGRDPESGLWEFAHVQSGEPARRGADGRLAIREETGIVLVLIPPGVATCGAQSFDRAEPHFDPLAESCESPVGKFELEPFFLSKFELTQAQWLRVTGSNPARYTPSNRSQYVDSLLHPVAYVDWRQCVDALESIGLCLPTETQWEYAARAGADTPWFSGNEPGSLSGCANLADARTVALEREGSNAMPGGGEWNDAFALTARVGSLLPNAFGLHDVLGNVSEWCRDRAPTDYRTGRAPGDAERRSSSDGARVLRGGDYAHGVREARSSARTFASPFEGEATFGVRPARRIER